MEDIFKKFSKISQKVLIVAQKISESMHSAIGPEHILIALTSTPNTIAYDILKENGITFDQIRLILSLKNINSAQTQGISSVGKNILERAAKIASDYKHISIDPEHLLLAILQDKNNLAYQILGQIGTETEKISKQIASLFNELSNIDAIIQEKLDQRAEISDGGLTEPNEFYDMPPSLGMAPAPKIKDPLKHFTTDLTEKAKNGQLDPVIGRNKEIERIIQILCRRLKNNPVLIGEAGVGKTAIAEGLAQRIVAGKVPEHLQNKKILSLDLALLVAGTVYRGQFEERLKKVMERVSKDKNIIIFLDEMHNLIGMGSAEGSMDAANILKPALTKSDLQVIGATTAEEYRKFIEKDAALERRFQVVKVEEPTVEETVQILKGLRRKYESFHKVTISDQAVGAAAKLSKRYIADRYLPDKAIDLIDEAAAALKVKMQGDKTLSKIQNLNLELKQVQKAKEKEVEAENFEKAAYLRAYELKLAQKTKKLKLSNHKDRPTSSDIDEKEIAAIVSQWTGVPLNSLVTDENKKYLNLAKNLSKRIVGQSEAIKKIAQALKRAKSRISDPNRPIGSFMFLGPTGVGKTHLAKELASELFGTEEALIKIDMSEFMERHNLSRLVGAPPGYVGFENAGKLTETIRRRPYSIVLFDEIEKAHPDIFNMMLQIMEDGYLTDASGKKVNFRNTIIIMTSNLGVEKFHKTGSIGFTKNIENDYEVTKNKVIDELKESFRPEFLNRLDQIIVFKPLGKKVLSKIVNLELDKLVGRLSEEHFQVEFSKKIKDHLAKIGFSSEYGARPLKRTVTDLVENPLSDKILANAYQKNSKIKIDYLKDKGVIFH